MGNFIEELKSDIEEAFNDTSKGGSCERLINLIFELSETYSDKRISDIKNTLRFVYPEKVLEINTYDKLKTIYEYSKLE